MEERYSRCLVLVAGDLTRGAEDALALREAGARVTVAGLCTADVRRRLKAAGIDTSGLARSRRAAAEAAARNTGGCDAVLFAEGAWKELMEEVRYAEQDAAMADGRGLIPMIDSSAGDFGFLRSPGERAVFTLARAVGMDFERAKAFAAERTGGHEKENHQAGRGRRGRKTDT